MSNVKKVSQKSTLHVRDTCLCLHVQRAARALARQFDNVFRPLDLTNGQFSLLMGLNRPDAPNVGALATVLGMDRTTITAAVKPLERRGLIVISIDEKDRRNRSLRLTAAGRALLETAYPLWQAAHAEVEATLQSSSPDSLRADLTHLATLPLEQEN